MLKELEKLLEDVFIKLNYDIKPRVIISNRLDLCDCQCDDSFRLAKLYKKNPNLIGNEIIAELNKSDDIHEYFNEITFENPGFINFKLSNSFINKYILKMINDDDFSIEKNNLIETCFLDYGGPNIAKPLHIGHLRSAIIGESLKRILKFKGYRTLSDAHFGDFGLQIGQVIYGILNDNKNAKLEEIDINIKYLEKLYPKMSRICKEDEDVLKKCQEITKDLQLGDETYTYLWKKICEVSLNDIKSIYNYLGVDFDFWYGESNSYPVIPEVIDCLENKNLVKVSDGAKIIEVKNDQDQKEIPPFILAKSDGAFLYSTTDLATIYERVNEFNPDYILYVVDERQALHFEQVFRASKLSGIASHNNLEHIGFGTINGTDGKPYKTRNGETPKLIDLIEEIKIFFISLKESNKNMSESDINKIANAILKYADLQNNRQKNYVFDIEKFSNVVGKTGPYLLYTYLRINKILDKSFVKKELSNTIYNDTDRNLRLKLLDLDNYLNLAVKERMPHFIAEYVYDLCVLANNFYQNNYMANLDNDDKKSDLTHIYSLTNGVIKQLLDLLLIEIPTIM